MKTIIKTIALIVIPVITGWAQNEVDALRYSQIFYGGTARTGGMAGAFGALGGDLSSISVNPAGIGVFRTSEFTFSPTFCLNNTETKFGSGLNSDFKYNFNLNNVGFEAAFLNENRKEGWLSTNIAFGYNKLNNFHQAMLLQNYSTTNSMTDFFAASANGKPYSELYQFRELLAWDRWLIDPDPSDTTGHQYVSSFDNYGEQQQKSIYTKGSMGEYFFSVGGNYSNIMYIGGTIGIQSLRYVQDAVYSEKDIHDTIPNFNEFTFTENLKTNGTGFNFKFGLLFRPTDWIRFGGAIHSPTFYNMSDHWNATMVSSFEDTTSGTNESPEGTYNYVLTTPFRAVGNLGLIIKKIAIIDVDYEFVDYSTARLRASDYAFYDENNNIETHYIAASNIRVGAELRFGPFSVRGGYGYYGSPYRNDQINKNAFRTVYTMGFGIKDKHFYFDIAYNIMKYSEKYYLWDPSVYPVDVANISANNNYIMTTFGFKF
jgi:hypothetical protein